jgi:hypothetical protein
MPKELAMNIFNCNNKKRSAYFVSYFGLFLQAIFHHGWGKEAKKEVLRMISFYTFFLHMTDQQFASSISS